jgi:hypothetical protein
MELNQSSELNKMPTQRDILIPFIIFSWFKKTVNTAIQLV